MQKLKDARVTIVYSFFSVLSDGESKVLFDDGMHASIHCSSSQRHRAWS